MEKCKRDLLRNELHLPTILIFLMFNSSTNCRNATMSVGQRASLIGWNEMIYDTLSVVFTAFFRVASCCGRQEALLFGLHKNHFKIPPTQNQSNRCKLSSLILEFPSPNFYSVTSSIVCILQNVHYSASISN